MLNIINHEGNANQNHNEIASHNKMALVKTKTKQYNVLGYGEIGTLCMEGP